MGRAVEIAQDVGSRHDTQKTLLFHDQQETCIVRTKRLYELLNGCGERDGRNTCIQEVADRLLLEPGKGSLLESFLGNDADNATIAFDRQDRKTKIDHDLQGCCRDLLLRYGRGMGGHDITYNLAPLGTPRGYRVYNLFLCSLSGCSVSQDGCCRMDPASSSQGSE